MKIWTNSPVTKKARLDFAVSVIYCCLFTKYNLMEMIGPIPWGHSGPLSHALSLSLSSLWTSHAACTIAIAGMRLATPGD